MKKVLLCTALLYSMLTISIAQVTKGLVSYYPFTNGSKTDSVTGQILIGNKPSPTTDRYGIAKGAYYFNQNDNAFFDTGDRYDSILVGNSATFTMSFWLWMPKGIIGTFHALLSKYANSECSQNQREITIEVSSAKQLTITIFGDLATINNRVDYDDTSTIFKDSTWYHIVMTYDKPHSSMKVFVNCLQDSLVKTTYGNGIVNGMQNGTAHFGIGARLSTTGTLCSASGYTFNGKMDDIRFYNRVLNQSEIDTLTRSFNTTITITNTSGANCNNGKIKLNFSGAFIRYPHIELYNAAGDLLKQIDDSANATTYTFTNLTSGKYTVKVYDAGTCLQQVIDVQVKCPKPTAGLTTTNITNHSAKINWTTVNCAAGYRIQYRIQGTTVWTSDTINSNTGSKTLKNLIADTTYEWHVQTKCLNAKPVVYSAYSLIQTFTTSASLKGQGTFLNYTTQRSFDINIKPNPVSNLLAIDFKSESPKAQLKIMNSMGQVLITKQIVSKDGVYNEQLNLSNLRSGTYILVVNTASGISEMRFLKE